MPKRFDCPSCQFAYECGSRVWECDRCETRRDLRPPDVGDGQLSLVRSDDTANKAAANVGLKL